MSIEIKEGYKAFGGFKYHLNFPDEWILNELPDTGRQCWNCVGKKDNRGHAMWRGIIIGYCANCAPSYEGQRGRGFLGLGIEKILHKYKSACSLYLGAVDFETLGDLADNPEDTMENRTEYLDDVTAKYFDDEADDDDRSDEYYNSYDEDDSGECLRIGCGKPCETMSAYCSRHARMYE
jgi:hypothetical protein